MTVPILRMPLTVLNGRMVTTPAGSPSEIAQSVGLLAATRTGERRSVPEYGIDEPLGELDGLREEQIRDAVDEWEPRADVTGVDVTTNPATGDETVTVWTQPYDEEEYD